MKNVTYALIALAVIAASIATITYFSPPSQAQARGEDVQMISFPTRRGAIYQDGEEYNEEKRLERYFSQGYRLVTVIEDTHPDAPPILVFKR